MIDNETMIINKLPEKTWGWLKVNETSIEWDKKGLQYSEEQIDIAENEERVIHVNASADSELTEKHISINAALGCKATVYMIISPEKKLGIYTDVQLGENSSVKIVQVQYSPENVEVYNEVTGDCAEGAEISIVQVVLGRGDYYSDDRIELSGEAGRANIDIGYIGQKKQALDMNIVVNHIGKKTECDINVNGALKDAARKVFKGTIDFKRGASDSVGNEQETVLLLGDDIVNKTVPLILCAEENVVGNHGATIGELDDDTLFYFESRGIGKAEAENIMAGAMIKKLLRLVEDEEVRAYIEKSFAEVV